MATTVRVPIKIENPQSSSNAGNSWQRIAAMSAADFMAWEFKKDVVGKVFGKVMVPPNYSSGGAIKLQVLANATAGVTTLSVATKAVADGESLNPTSYTDETDQDITVPSTANQRKEVSFTLTETLAANDLLLVEIHHVGTATNDTLAVNTLIAAAQLEITVT